MNIELNAITYQPNYRDTTEQIRIIQAYKAGAMEMQKEYEEKLRWIPVEEKLPEFNDSEYPNGNFEEYEVKFCTGGMSPKYFIRISHLINKTKFSGEFDWTHATHWRRIL